jgi:heme a synthase
MENSGKYRPVLLARWLYACCGLIFAMIVVGAITRLTDSGLSITEWKPLLGAIPPLNETQWQHVFDLYKQSPQFEKQHFWMELHDFKFIYFWEWLHRLLGRFIGLAYALPLLFFWLRGRVPPRYKFPLLGFLCLGGAQGFMGWYMVQSGLIDVPAVSHYRLAAHLGLALLLFAAILWTALSLHPTKSYADKKLFTHGCIAFLFFLTTVLWGAFTAGLDGGLLYNDSFPKMGGAWIPPEAKQSLLNTPAGVQFAHRWLAIATFVMVLGFWAHAKIRHNAFPALQALAAMMFIQAGLGIATLFSHVWLPLAVLHQAGAVILLTLFVITLWQLGSTSKSA